MPFAGRAPALAPDGAGPDGARAGQADAEAKMAEEQADSSSGQHMSPPRNDNGGMLEGRWLEVFRAGDYGEKGNYGREDLDRIVANYDAKLHEAPVVIGHPEADAPAYGWVARLRRVDDVLEASLRDVDAGFEDLLKSGKFKKRSVALYNDLDGRGVYLRHLGFLGAQPPTVKGLKSVFHDDAANGFVVLVGEASGLPREGGALPYHEIKEETMTLEEVKKAFCEALEGVGLKKPQDPPTPAVAPDGARPALHHMVQGPGEPSKTFSEAELKAAEEKAAAVAKADAERQFAERQKAAEGERAQKQHVAEFIAGQEKAGRWIPAFDKAGLRTFAESLSTEQTFTFGEGEKTTKKSQFEIFKAFVQALPKIVEFGERKLGTAGKPKGAVKFTEPARPMEVVGIELDARARELIGDAKKSGSMLAYGEALQLAREEAREAGAGQTA